MHATLNHESNFVPCPCYGCKVMSIKCIPMLCSRSWMFSQVISLSHVMDFYGTSWFAIFFGVFGMNTTRESMMEVSVVLLFSSNFSFCLSRILHLLFFRLLPMPWEFSTHFWLPRLISLKAFCSSLHSCDFGAPTSRKIDVVDGGEPLRKVILDSSKTVKTTSVTKGVLIFDGSKLSHIVSLTFFNLPLKISY